MKFLNFAVIKLTTCLIIGILTAYFLPIPISVSFYVTGVLLFFTALIYFLSKGKKKTIWFGLLSLITMLAIGVLVTNLHDEKQKASNYTQFTSVEKQITFRIRSKLKPGVYHDKYIIDVLKIDSLHVSGKALLNVVKDSLATPLKVDAVFIATEALKDITGVINPYQFNYRGYLEKQYVYKQLFVAPKRLFRVSENKHTIFGYADAVRETINTKLNNYNFHPDVLAIINALILGQRQNLSREIYDDYKDAGAVHILAVSGLHVGIIVLLLSYIFGLFLRFKYGKPITMLLLLVSMWSFAIIAGLSASVTRAVTMFSIIVIAKYIKRPDNIYNTLAISIFVLLLCKPLFIFDVGFQLSYMAVIAIVALQPKLAAFWQPKYTFINTLWIYFTVGIAAQIGVLPISLFYFHQFPGLFFVANIVIIPFLKLILGSGILVILLAISDALPQLIIDSFSWIISSMNYIMKWVAQQDQFLFKDISFSIYQVFASYLLIIAIVQLALKRNAKWLTVTLATIIIFQGTFIFSKYKKNNHEFTVFHKSRFTIIGEKKNNALLVYSDLDSLKQFYSLNYYTIGHNIKTIKNKPLPNVLNLAQNKLLIIDSLAVYKVKRFNPDLVLLTQSPKLNLTRLIDSLKPKGIIADGSNYKTYIARWKATCKAKKIPFHYTGEKGAFIFKVK